MRGCCLPIMATMGGGGFSYLSCQTRSGGWPTSPPSGSAWCRPSSSSPRPSCRPSSHLSSCRPSSPRPSSSPCLAYQAFSTTSGIAIRKKNEISGASNLKIQPLPDPRNPFKIILMIPLHKNSVTLESSGVMRKVVKNGLESINSSTITSSSSSSPSSTSPAV